MPFKTTGFEDFDRDLTAMFQKRTIHEKLRDRFQKPIAKMVIGSAKAGIAPGNAKYADYSASYKKAIERAGITHKLWLFGFPRLSSLQRAIKSAGKGIRIGKIGRIDATKKRVVKRKAGDVDHMLNPDNFRITVEQTGRAWLVWTAENEPQAIYGSVHQDGTALTPQRKWLHFENAANEAMLMSAYEQSIAMLSAQFSAGLKPK